MTDANAVTSELSPDPELVVRRLFFLEVSTNRIQAMNPDGSDRTVIVTDCRLPDGVAIDVRAGHIYWTNMGSGVAINDGSIERADIDGTDRKVIVPRGATFTPKQIQLDRKCGKLYWCDREGMRGMRCNLDGTDIETLIEAGRGEVDRRDPTRWCIGVTIDTERRRLYWTQKGPDNAGQGRIFRANIDIPNGESPANRYDIEVLFEGLPEPVHLELDLANRVLYWTDRGDPPRGNTVNRARVDLKTDPEILITHHYLNGAADVHDWGASPARAQSLAGLPPAYVLTAGADLRDEGNEYAARLSQAGVPVTTKHYPGQFHGFFTMGKLLPQANVAVSEIGAWLKAL